LLWWMLINLEKGLAGRRDMIDLVNDSLFPWKGKEGEGGFELHSWDERDQELPASN